LSLFRSFSAGREKLRPPPQHQKGGMFVLPPSPSGLCDEKKKIGRRIRRISLRYTTHFSILDDRLEGVRLLSIPHSIAAKKEGKVGDFFSIPIPFFSPLEGKRGKGREGTAFSLSIIAREVEKKDNFFLSMVKKRRKKKRGGKKMSDLLHPVRRKNQPRHACDADHFASEKGREGDVIFLFRLLRWEGKVRMWRGLRLCWCVRPKHKKKEGGRGGKEKRDPTRSMRRHSPAARPTQGEKISGLGHERRRPRNGYPDVDKRRRGREEKGGGGRKESTLSSTSTPSTL